MALLPHPQPLPPLNLLLPHSIVLYPFAQAAMIKHHRQGAFTIGLCFLPILEAASLRARCQRGGFVCRPQGKSLFPSLTDGCPMAAFSRGSPSCQAQRFTWRPPWPSTGRGAFPALLLHPVFFFIKAFIIVIYSTLLEFIRLMSVPPVKTEAPKVAAQGLPIAASVDK